MNGPSRSKAVRLAALGALVAVGVAFAHPPRANLSILTHDAGDLSPHRVQAALDLGVMAVSVLVTWSNPPLR